MPDTGLAGLQCFMPASSNVDLETGGEFFLTTLFARIRPRREGVRVSGRGTSANLDRIGPMLKSFGYSEKRRDFPVWQLPARKKKRAASGSDLWRPSGPPRRYLNVPSLGTKKYSPREAMALLEAPPTDCVTLPL